MLAPKSRLYKGSDRTHSVHFVPCATDYGSRKTSVHSKILQSTAPSLRHPEQVPRLLDVLLSPRTGNVPGSRILPSPRQPICKGKTCSVNDLSLRE